MVNVYLDMCADLFHWGHVNMLKNAKAMGDKLIVGIHSDETIRSYKRDPIMNMKERIMVVEACKYVDNVVPDAPLVITEEYIKKHNIGLVIHGHSEEENEKYNFMYNIPHKMGIFKRVEYTEGISTSEIIKRLKDRI
jgi:cytidyltransferase-like protein